MSSALSLPRRIASSLTAYGVKVAWASGFLVGPALLLRGAVGVHRVPGLPLESLFSTLFAGAQLERWLLGAATFGQADLVHGGQPYWPAQSSHAGVLAVLNLVLDEPIAYAVVLVLALWLAGLGPALLARKMLGDGHLAACTVAGLAVQLSPPVLRSVWDAELAILAVGPVALALAARSRWSCALWALIAGGMGWIAAALCGLGAGILRRPWAGLATLPLVLAVALPSAALPGATQALPTPSTASSYVTMDRAVLPAGFPALTPPRLVEPDDSGWLGLPARVHGGPVAVLGCLLALCWRRTRAWGSLGAVALVLLHAGLGPLPQPGSMPAEPAGWWVAVKLALPGASAAGGPLIPVVLAAGLGLGAVVRWRREASVLVLALCLWTSPLLPLDSGVPVTNFPPLPAASALSSAGAGPVLILPAWSYGQPGAGFAEQLHLAARLGRPAALGSGEWVAPAFMAHTAWLLDVPVHQDAATALWDNRHEAPLDAARSAGFAGLLVDAWAYSPEQIALLRAELFRLVGPPAAEGERWLAWAL